MILVTGSDGYIGQTLIQLLRQHEIPFVGMDRKSGPDILSAAGQVQFEEYASKADVVIHLAARPRIPPSWTETSDYIRDNIQLTEYVARVCAEKKCHLIFASSSSVVGNGNGPLNPYSWTKQSCEDIIKIHNPAHTILRIFTTYGNNGPLVLDKWVSQYKRGELITLRGDGTQKRDFIHVEDVARALIKASQVTPNGLTLDVGTGTTLSLRLLASMFGSEVYQEPELRGYAYSTCAKASQTKELLDWTPAYSVESWILTNLSS